MKKSLMLVSVLALNLSVAGAVSVTPWVWSVAGPAVMHFVAPYTVVGQAVAQVALFIVALLLVAALAVKTARVPRFVPSRSLTLRALVALAFGATLGTASAVSLTDGVGGVLFSAVLPYLLTAAGAFGVTALGWGASFVKGKAAGVKNDNLRKALELLDTLVFSKVTEIFQHAVSTLKDGASDGKLTPDEAQAALGTAVKEVWASLPDLIKKLLSGIAGGEKAAQDAFIVPKVEVAVKNVTSLSTVSTPGYPKAVPPTTAEVTAARLRLGLGLKPTTKYDR